MFKDLSNQKKIDPQAVLAAIKTLQEKGCDVNPRSVAEEAGIPRSAIYSSPELIGLIKQAQGIESTEQSNDMLKCIAELASSNQELEAQNIELQKLNAHVNGQLAELSLRVEELSQLLNLFELRQRQADQQELGMDDSGEGVIFLEPEEEESGSETCDDLPQEAFARGMENTLDTADGDIPPDKGLASGFERFADDDKAADGQEMPSKTGTLTEEEIAALLKHRFKPQEEAPAADEDISKRKASSKFIGGNRSGQEPPSGFVIRSVPPDIRKASRVLGLRPEEISVQAVHAAWKKAMISVHPDQGGDAETAVYLNVAKDTLYRFLDAQAPKLGRQFGSGRRNNEKPQEAKSGD